MKHKIDVMGKVRVRIDNWYLPPSREFLSLHFCRLKIERNRDCYPIWFSSPLAALPALGEHHSLGQRGAQGHLSMMEHCTSTHGHGGLGPAIFVTIPAAVPVEARALAPAVASSALPVAPPAAAPAPKFRPNSFAIVVKCSPFVFYLLVFFQQRTRTLFLWGTRTSHTHTCFSEPAAWACLPAALSPTLKHPHQVRHQDRHRPLLAITTAVAWRAEAVSRQGARKRVSAWNTFPSHADRRIASQCSFLPVLAFYF